MFDLLVVEQILVKGVLLAAHCIADSRSSFAVVSQEGDSQIAAAHKSDV